MGFRLLDLSSSCSRGGELTLSRCGSVGRGRWGWHPSCLAWVGFSGSRAVGLGRATISRRFLDQLKPLIIHRRRGGLGSRRVPIGWWGWTRAIRRKSGRVGVGSGWLGWGRGDLGGLIYLIFLGSCAGALAGGVSPWVGGRVGLVCVGRPGSSRRGAGGLSLWPFGGGSLKRRGLWASHVFSLN
jgi:hypothetical protein